MTQLIRCHECGALLRVDGVDLTEIHTDSEGEDVCENCCDVCAAEEIDGLELEEALELLLE